MLLGKFRNETTCGIELATLFLGPVLTPDFFEQERKRPFGSGMGNTCGQGLMGIVDAPILVMEFQAVAASLLIAPEKLETIDQNSISSTR